MEEIKDLLRIEACQAPQRQSVYEPLAAQVEEYQALFA